MRLDLDAAFLVNRVLHALDGSIPLPPGELVGDISYLHAVACQTTAVYTPINVQALAERATP